MKTQTLDPVRPATNPAVKGFTRTDLLAVLAAGGVLSGLFLPALANGGGGSAAAGCLNNLRQLSQALWQFAEDHNGWFPRTRMMVPSTTGSVVGPASGWHRSSTPS